MYSAQLLTTLSLFTLPLTILSAPAPAPIAALQSRGGPAYFIVQTSTSLFGAALGQTKSFTVTVKGDGPNAADVTCTGSLDWPNTKGSQTAGLGCSDGQVHVFVTTDEAQGSPETYSVQDRDLAAASGTIQPGGCGVGPYGGDAQVCSSRDNLRIGG
ncbi:MAG: hypothetical protein Q9168_006151 [Polycauliona sp. 1 TL-2023]